MQTKWRVCGKIIVAWVTCDKIFVAQWIRIVVNEIVSILTKNSGENRGTPTIFKGNFPWKKYWIFGHFFIKYYTRLEMKMYDYYITKLHITLIKIVFFEFFTVYYYFYIYEE